VTRLARGPALALALAVLVTGCAFVPREGSPRDESAGFTVPALFLAEDAPPRLVCGHRGDFFVNLIRGSSNTLESFEGALRVGADLVEVDVRITADRIPVIAHDGGVETRSVAAWLARGERLLELHDVLIWACGRTVLLLDVKSRDVAAVATAVRGADAVDRVLFLAGGPGEYDRIREAGADLWVVARARKPDDVTGWLGRGDVRIVAVHGNPGWMDSDLIDRVHAAGKKVWLNAWDATWHQELFGGESLAIELFERGADIIHSNVPADAARARDAR